MFSIDLLVAQVPTMSDNLKSAAVAMAAEHVGQTATFPTHVSRDFFLRMFATPSRTYSERLASLGYSGQARVLDAGCGFGQWSIPLATVNARVDAMDLDVSRCDIVRQLASELHLENLHVRTGSVLDLPYPDESFDAVYCYGTIFLVDWRSALRELARVTRPGGVLYCSAVGLGWYLHNLLDGHNDSVDYSTRKMALRSAISTLTYRLANRPPIGGGQLSIAPRHLRRELMKLGFDNINIASDGRSGTWIANPPSQFFPGSYCGLPCCYEARAIKT